MASVQMQNISVLVVDDKEFIRNMMKRLLENLGVTQVAYAGNGKEAMNNLIGGTRRFDVVFCDLQMPDMDGVEVVRNASSIDSPPAFVFVSGTHNALLATAEDMARARGITVLGTVRKPVSLEAIKQILGRVQVSDGTPALQPKSVKSTYVPTKADLEAALGDTQFLLHYQPKQNLRTGEIDGFESLVRWRHPDHGLIPPGLFIGEAERADMIAPLTDWVVMAALNQCSLWNHSGLRTKVSINMSAYMLVDLSLPDRMSAEAQRAGVDPSQIILEVTESGVFADSADTLDILARLNMKGFDLSIDDFGTGYSSMEQLRRVPFAEMKIDRAFVYRLPENPRARAIVESSVVLARSLGMSVVAEGAESDDELLILRQLGIDLVQGYIIAKPMPADSVPIWLAKEN